MSRRLLPAAVLLAIVAASSWQVWGPTHAPIPQPPLETLTTQNFSGFGNAFDNAAGDVRLILLLSPT
jgi:hypothetical protein